VVTILVILIVVYMMLSKKPTCTAGDDCSSTITTKDPNADSYQWDSDCNCNLVSCVTGYSPTNGVCVANSPTPSPSPAPGPTPTPSPKPSPTPSGCQDPCTGSDPYGTYKCQNNACALTGCVNGYGLNKSGSCVPTYFSMAGFVDKEDADDNPPVSNVAACQEACSSTPECMVFSWSSGDNDCKWYKDYRSVTGYGGDSNHNINNVAPTTRTYVKAFAPTAYITPWAPAGTMGTQQFATFINATVDSRVKPYATMANADCYSECQSNPKCKGTFYQQQADGSTTCNLYDTLDPNVDIIGASSDYGGSLKIKSTL